MKQKEQTHPETQPITMDALRRDKYNKTSKIGSNNENNNHWMGIGGVPTPLIIHKAYAST